MTSLRGKLSAAAHGEVPTEGLAAYGSANADAYDMLDGLPSEGKARLCAWCAFVFQTHADNLIASGSAPGYCDAEAYAEATMLYELAGAWLNRARDAQAAPDRRLDAVVPMPFPRPQGSQSRSELSALRETLETVQSRLGADLGSRQGEPVFTRVQPAVPAMQSALDTSAGLAAGRSVSMELAGTMAQTLRAALDRGFEAGQLLAMTELIAGQDATPTDEPPAAVAPAALTMFLPGDPRFDRWCLTDPLVHERLADDPASAALLDHLWSLDPDPEKTLAIQSGIATLLEQHAADYLPDDVFGALEEVGKKCPWPGVLVAKAPFSIDGQQFAKGDRLTLAVGEIDGVFQRSVLRLPREQ